MDFLCPAGEGEEGFFHVGVEAAAGHDVVGTGVASGLQQVFGDVGAPGEDADALLGGRGTFGWVAQAGDEGEAFVAFVQVNQQGLDVGRVGEACFEHFHGANGACGQAHGVGGRFDFAGPDEVSGGVEEHGAA